MNCRTIKKNIKNWCLKNRSKEKSYSIRRTLPQYSVPHHTTGYSHQLLSCLVKLARCVTRQTWCTSRIKYTQRAWQKRWRHSSMNCHFFVADTLVVPFSKLFFKLNTFSFYFRTVFVLLVWCRYSLFFFFLLQNWLAGRLTLTFWVFKLYAIVFD